MEGGDSPLRGTELRRCDSRGTLRGGQSVRRTPGTPKLSPPPKLGVPGTETTETLAGASENGGEGGPERVSPHLCPRGRAGPALTRV